MPADPQQIQREIEATRAELAATVEAIADKVSPKKVAARSVASVKDAALSKGLTAYAAVENVFAPHPVPPAIPPLPLSKRVKYDRIGSVLIGLGLFIVAVVSFRGRPAKWERKQAKLQNRDVAKLSRKARKKAAKLQKKTLAARHQAGTTALANLAAARKTAGETAKQSRKDSKKAAATLARQAKHAAAQTVGQVTETAGHVAEAAGHLASVAGSATGHAGGTAKSATAEVKKQAKQQAKATAKVARKQAKSASKAAQKQAKRVKEFTS